MAKEQQYTGHLLHVLDIILFSQIRALDLMVHLPIPRSRWSKASDLKNVMTCLPKG